MTDPRAFNELAAYEARARLLTCLDVPRWAHQVVAGRQYAEWSGLEAAMRSAALTITDEELTLALARHPRIGERADADRHEATHSEREQSAIDRSDEELARALLEGNRAYEERFGRVFIIRAAGRDGQQVLDQLRIRLTNTDEQERAETIEQLVQIALLRAKEVLV
ncbi:2-oxo-4-hydroxy-4-carboxy-5-ureidoimidazoline decarboxylase [Ornithinimicrobium sp. F0845]|uniref:2-oxo-4-hydroxy-4-carboxy-5-ureidoimidazoline decarboxylase n=1 Tax=Ornithinimicrobium sp. F0845 TaxID=2926412 RepID=UPI001FF42633|nr:2-oxo-4-hydroxy-4-carboxy-5-ureidoimidazoline decarboxylase [Ornithinimicrobium sp. F0845]MCK0113446.1 2-oxo-4-hydroxy-4-carboxy-5-ureidoimidazoline decarboxylase [Ornithinimicrobium sp. F0845]